MLSIIDISCVYHAYINHRVYIMYVSCLYHTYIMQATDVYHAHTNVCVSHISSAYRMHIIRVSYVCAMIPATGAVVELPVEDTSVGDTRPFGLVRASRREVSHASGMLEESVLVEGRRDGLSALLEGLVLVRLLAVIGVLTGPRVLDLLGGRLHGRAS